MSHTLTQTIPGASLAADWSLGFVGRALGLNEVDFVISSGSQSQRSAQQRRQFLGRGGFSSSHLEQRQ